MRNAENGEKKTAGIGGTGYKSDILREEPFTIARDSLGYKVYLMIWKKKGATWWWKSKNLPVNKSQGDGYVPALRLFCCIAYRGGASDQWQVR